MNKVKTEVTTSAKKKMKLFVIVNEVRDQIMKEMAPMITENKEII
jgi:hypothetical protein